MDEVTAEKVAEKRTALAAEFPNFDRQRQVERATAFLRDILVARRIYSPPPQNAAMPVDCDAEPASIGANEVS
jgi:hypothetical protein